MRSRATTGTLAVVLLAALSGCQPSSDVDASDVVVGVDLPLTGSASAVGVAYRQALQLQADRINANKVLGRRKVRLEIRDNLSDTNSSGSLANVTELANIPDTVAVIAPLCDPCLSQAASIGNSQQVSIIALTGADDAVAPVDQRRYQFKIGPNLGDDVSAIANDLGRLRLSRVSVIANDDAYGKAAVPAIRNELSKPGPVGNFDLVPPTVLPTGDAEATQPVQAMMAAMGGRPSDAVVAFVRPAQAGKVAAAARAAGFKGRLYFDASATGDVFLQKSVSAAMEDSMLVSSQMLAIDDTVAATPAKANRRQWFQDYVARYGGYQGYVSYAADALQVVVSAVERAGSDNRRAVRDAIESTQLDGLTGPIRITPINHSGLTPQALTFLVARGDRWRLAS